MTVQRLTRIFNVLSGQVIELAGITAHVRLRSSQPGALVIQIDATEEEYQRRLRIVRHGVRPAEIGLSDPDEEPSEKQGSGGAGQLGGSMQLGAAEQPDGAGRLTVREVPPSAAGGSTEPWDPESSLNARRQAAEHAANRIGGVSVAVPPDCPVLLQECRSVDLTADGGTLDATVTGSGAIQIRGTQNLALTVAGGGAALLSDIGGIARITASGAAAVELSGGLELLQIAASDRALIRGQGDFFEVGGAVVGRGRIDLDGQVQRMAVDIFGGGSLSVNGRRVR